MSHQKLAMCIQTRHILTKTAGPSDSILRLLGKAPARRTGTTLGPKASLALAGATGAGLAVGGMRSGEAAKELVVQNVAKKIMKENPGLTVTDVFRIAGEKVNKIFQSAEDVAEKVAPIIPLPTHGPKF